MTALTIETVPGLETTAYELIDPDTSLYIVHAGPTENHPVAGAFRATVPADPSEAPSGPFTINYCGDLEEHDLKLPAGTDLHFAISAIRAAAHYRGDIRMDVELMRLTITDLVTGQIDGVYFFPNEDRARLEAVRWMTIAACMADQPDLPQAFEAIRRIANRHFFYVEADGKSWTLAEVPASMPYATVRPQTRKELERAEAYAY